MYFRPHQVTVIQKCFVAEIFHQHPCHQKAPGHGQYSFLGSRVGENTCLMISIQGHSSS